MSKFISIPGMAPSRTTGRGRPPMDEIAGGAWGSRVSEQLGEWFRSREQTSHDSLGLDPGMKVDFVTPAGEHRPGEVLREEHDAHTGTVDAYVKSSDSTGVPQEHRLRFAPDQARSLRQVENKRVK